MKRFTYGRADTTWDTRCSKFTFSNPKTSDGTYFSVKRVESAIPFLHELMVIDGQHLNRVHVMRLDVLHQSVIGYSNLDHDCAAVIFNVRHTNARRPRPTSTCQRLFGPSNDWQQRARC